MIFSMAAEELIELSCIYSCIWADVRPKKGLHYIKCVTKMGEEDSFMQRPSYHQLMDKTQCGQVEIP